MVYVIKGDKLFALDRDDGSIKWSYEFPPSNYINPPAITSEGTLIVSLVHTSESDYYGVIYAFETESFAGLDSTAPWPMYRANPQRTGERQ
jgi:outer membrane protein assembly factor BamB